MIFGLDPAVGVGNAAGVSLFNPEIKRCVAADVIRPSKDVPAGVYRWLYVARAAADWAVANNLKGSPITLVAEMPKVYPNERKKDPNTALVPLAGVLTAVAAYLEHLTRGMVLVVAYEPREWKGTIPGDVFTERILERLDPRERAIVDAIQPPFLRHNAVDAVGLCLKYLGRMERTRVIHNEVG